MPDRDDWKVRLAAWAVDVCGQGSGLVQPFCMWIAFAAGPHIADRDHLDLWKRLRRGLARQGQIEPCRGGEPYRRCAGLERGILMAEADRSDLYNGPAKGTGGQ